MTQLQRPVTAVTEGKTLVDAPMMTAVDPLQPYSADNLVVVTRWCSPVVMAGVAEERLDPILRDLAGPDLLGTVVIHPDPGKCIPSSRIPQGSWY